MKCYLFSPIGAVLTRWVGFISVVHSLKKEDK